MSYYIEQERSRQIQWAKSHGHETGAVYKGIPREFVLLNGTHNLFKGIREDSVKYFKDFNISWWGGPKPTGHLLSSQIACLNHLFLLRNDPQMILTILNNIRNEYVEVLLLQCDMKTVKGEEYKAGYVAFEAVSDVDYLNEGTPQRGSNCTSLDAVILAKHKSGKKHLILIEWKYTESYATLDKSMEDGKGKPKGGHEKGDERLRRYSDLITSSHFLKTMEEYRSSIYFQEPFYQLMRQTLWAEQMILHKSNESIKADDYLHLHVVPSENHDLLQHNYKRFNMSEGMESAWRNVLTENGTKRYCIVTPKNLISPIKEKYGELYDYLAERYYGE